MKMSQNQLAIKSNVSRAYITLIEIGDRLNPSHEVMANISHALEKTIPEVFFPKQINSKVE